ncbi:MAG TPA: EamA family transporter [Candidatus Nanoarchaeia archaeon]|nr:EamA family transporter [Candidatus Nanoarchaeia archaeon]
MIPALTIVYGITSAIIGAFGGLFLKKGAKNFSLRSPINLGIFIGGTLYVIGLGFFVVGLKGTPLSFFYPLGSLMQLFASLLGFIVLKEKASKYKIIGICLIMTGIVLNSIGR